MSQLQNDPIRVIPKRVIQLALVFTFFIAVITMVFKLPIVNVLIGYWLGVVVNLINFRLIVIGTKNALEQQEKGAKSTMKTNLLLRLVIYAGSSCWSRSYYLGTPGIRCSLHRYFDGKICDSN